MRLLMAAAVLVQVLSGPDPAQMEKAPNPGYVPVEHGLSLPEGYTWGAPSAVAFNSAGHFFVLARAPHPLLEFDKNGKFLRSLGEGRFPRSHGLRIDRDDNLWTTDVVGHTVTKWSPKGEPLLTLGVQGQAGPWDEAANSRLLNEPNDVGFAANGDIFVVEGHGKGDPRVLKFDKSGRFLKTWGGLGTGPGQFDLAHSVLVDAQGLVYVADRQNRRVQIFDGEGTYLKEWKFAGLPCSLTYGPDRRMYLSSGFAGQILQLDGNGKAVTAFGQPGKALGEFGEAHIMTVAPNGDIWVGDTVKPALHKFVKR